MNTLKVPRCNIRYIFFLITLIFVIFYLFIFINFKPPYMKINSPGDGYSIKTIGCSIPSLNPFDPAILPYLFKKPPLKCSKLPPLVTSSKENTLQVNLSVLPLYEVTKWENFECCYQELKRVEQPPKGIHRELSKETYNISTNCVNFKVIAYISTEFVRVICKNNGKEIYRDFHSFAPFKKPSLAKKPSVMVLGIDSISRANLHRQMPKTVQYLEQLNAIEFFGYNKVGDNTFPNIIPILTGKSELELYSDCLNSKWLPLSTKFDDCNFIWNNYSRAGFLTAFAEDSSWMGLFNYRHKYGFRKPFTDYNWGTFNYASETELGSSPYNTSIFMCMGPRRIYQVLLDYIEKLVYTLKDHSFFGWFWQCSLSHAQMNFASVSDDDYKDFFQLLNETNVLNNTFVIFISDHGQRYGNILLTHQGFLESRLPFMYVLTPPWFANKYPKAVQNLRTNAKRLVSNFDIHEMLNDLINVEKLTDDMLEKRQVRDARGLSLFLPIPETRTCTSAGIEPHYCTCFQSTEVLTNDEVVKNVAYFVVDYIVNILLLPHGVCAELALDEILDARLLTSQEFWDLTGLLRPKSTLYNYIVKLRTQPGGGIFAATVRCNNCDKTGDFEIQGGITRLNKFGNDGACIADAHLQMYCYCKVQFDPVGVKQKTQKLKKGLY